MTFLLDDIQTYLVAQLGLVFGTNLFVGFMPDEPDTVTIANEYQGQPPEYVMGSNNPLPALGMPNLQIVTRDLTYSTARSNCENAVRKLELVVNQTINTTYYERIARLQDPFFFHRDNKRRVMFVCNLTVTRTPT